MTKHSYFQIFKTPLLCVLGMVFLLGASPIPTQEKPAEESAEDTREKIFNAESFTLDNGLDVVVIPNHKTPVVTHMIWYKVGAADEPLGKSGIAHFLEHLLFKGSGQIGGEDLAPGEFSKIVRRLGGRDNAFTSQDYTAYFQSIPAEHLETVMRMEAGRMNGLKVPMEEVHAERKVILEERKQRTDNDPRGQFAEQMAAAAFVNHPYANPIIGWEHEMDTLSYGDAHDFYQMWYAPNNAVVVISGDVTPANAFKLAIEVYGELPREDIPARYRTQSPPLNSQHTISLEHPAIKEPVVQTLFRVPSARMNKDTSLALDVLSEILGGGQSSRLYQALVAKQKIASNAGVSYRSVTWDDSSFWVYATPLPGQDLEAVRKAYKAELQKIVDKGVSDDELRDAKTRLQDRAIFARDSIAGPAMIFGYSLVSGLSMDDIEFWPYDIGSVSAAQIQDAAKIYLNPQNPRDIPPVDGTLLPGGDEE